MECCFVLFLFTWRSSKIRPICCQSKTGGEGGGVKTGSITANRSFTNSITSAVHTGSFTHQWALICAENGSSSLSLFFCPSFYVSVRFNSVLTSGVVSTLLQKHGIIKEGGKKGEIKSASSSSHLQPPPPFFSSSSAGALTIGAYGAEY